MTITSVGYAGTVGEAQWASMINRVGGAVYSVDDFASFRVAVAGGTRALSVAAGKASAFGIYDTSSSAVPVTLDSVPSGTRWDLVVLRRTWGTKLTSVEVVQGGSTKALPARTVTPGTVVDQPLALARVIAGSTVVQEIVDLRCVSANSGLIAFDDLARSYLDAPGSEVRIGDSQWSRVYDVTGSPKWISSEMGDTGWIAVPPGPKWTTVADYPLRVRKVGVHVVIRGAEKATSGADMENLGTLAAAFWPTANTPLGVAFGSAGTIGELFVNTNGRLTISDLYRTGTNTATNTVMVHGSYFKD